MAAERLSMRCIRDILRLHFTQQQSPRTIAKSQGCGRTTIQRYIDRVNTKQLTWPLIESMTDVELEIQLGFNNELSSRYRPAASGLTDIRPTGSTLPKGLQLLRKIRKSIDFLPDIGEFSRISDSGATASVEIGAAILGGRS